MNEPLEVPSPPRPRRLNRLALVAVLSVLGVALAAVFFTLRPPRRAKAAGELPETAAPAPPGFLERAPGAPAGGRPRAPAEAPGYWQEAMGAGRAPGGAAGGAAGAGAGAAGPAGMAGGTAAAGEAGAAGLAGAAGSDVSEGYEAALAAGAPPGGGAGQAGRPGAGRGAAPPPSPRQEAYQRALRAPVTPPAAARGGAEGAGGAEGGGGEGEGAGAAGWRLPAAPAMLPVTGAGLAGLAPQAALAGLAPAGPDAVGAAPVEMGRAGSAGRQEEARREAGAGWGRADHQSFLRGAETLAPRELAVRRDRAPAGLVLEAGTVVPAALVTAVVSDVAGPLVAQVTRDVFDREQRVVLIPRGARLIGAYDSQVAVGERRLLVAWTRVIFPDGSGVSFPGLPAATRSGEAGLQASVDNHLARVFGSALLLSVLGAGAQLSQPQESAAFGAAASPRQVAAAAVGQELSSVAVELLRRQLTVPPTLRIEAGTSFVVLVRGDVSFDGGYGN
jgi:type IV secretion system protein TrbI